MSTELIERIRMLVEANAAKDRYIKQLELQIERDRHGGRKDAPPPGPMQ